MQSILGLGTQSFSGKDLMLVNEGALAEQLVGQALLHGLPPYESLSLHYWVRESKSSSAEVDYVIANGSEVIPVEVKAGKRGTLKSLHLFMTEKKSKRGLRFNTGLPTILPGKQPILSLPLYLAEQARRILAETTV